MLTRTEAPTRLALHHAAEHFAVQCVTGWTPYSSLYSLYSCPRAIVYMLFINLYCQFEPIQTAGKSLENMQIIPGIFLWSRCPVFASIELSTMNNQMSSCGPQCNYILFLYHLHLELLLTQQNGSGKIQSVIRLLPVRDKSSEPSLPLLYVLCNLSDRWLQHVLHLTGSHVLHWSGSATPLFHLTLLISA